MAKKISEIFDEYKIMPNLQEHMFRVAAVASMICDNFQEPLLKSDIVTACLLHDMGNIIKSNLNYFSEFLEPKGLEYWQKVKNQYIEKYGVNEHQATLKIIMELGVSKKVSDLVAIVDFSDIFTLPSKSIEEQITLYADSRVTPLGIVSFQERLLEGRNRYKNRENSITDEQRKIAGSIFATTENSIFSKCKIKPEDINNEIVAPIISSLKDFVIK